LREIEDLNIDKDRITLTQRRELQDTEKEIETLVNSLEKRIKEYSNKEFEIDLKASTSD